VKQKSRQERSPFLRWILALAVVVCVAAALSWRPAIAPLPTGALAAVDAGAAQRGASLAAIGQCASCHTANPSAPYAGGVPISTPFGVVYSTNITPDRATGIGSWPEAAFVRAMQAGISRDGHHLYPAFPYDHYTRLETRDISAIYAFMMTRDPLHAPARDNRMRFPFGFRPLVAGWNLLYLDRSPVRPEPARDATWNRGAYLAQSLGHCSACHSPRNALGGENMRRYLGGGEAEGWYVPALNADSPSPLPWTVDHLALYLRTGIAPDHAIAGGPMQGVTANLAQADPGEVRALATYIVSLMGKPGPAVAANARQAVHTAAPLPPAAAGDSVEARQLQLGAAVYADACARCHDGGRAVSSGGALQLPAAIALYDPDPRSLIRIIREGVPPVDGQPGRWMPAFAEILTDQQVTALAAYLRHHGAHAAPWPNLPAAVQKAKTPP
jgi:mono/diheme cytochrome c family protein